MEFDRASKTRLREYEKSVRTAQGLYESGTICAAAKERIFAALTEADEIFDFRAQEVYAVTTQAMRLASNAQQIIDEIEAKFSVKFKIIDGDTEARLTLLGVENGMRRAQIHVESYCMLDLGGGSSEISFVRGDTIASKSFGFGIVQMAERYITLKAIGQNILSEISVIDTFVKEQAKPSIFVATAGTPTTVSAFLQGIDYNSYDYKKVSGKLLHVDDFTSALAQLLELEESKREFWVGTNRSDLVCAGILIVKAIMKKLGFDECLVIDDGLREGLAISKC